MKEEYLYVYGIVNNKKINLDVKGLKNKLITKFDFDGLSALISPYPTLNPMLTEEEVMQHAEILQKIAQKTTIIPMSFGTVFKNEKILEVVLSKSYPSIKRTLEIIKDKIELGVKVIKNQSEIPDETIVQEILESLKKLSVENVKGENFSEILLLNYSFLVKKNNFSKFSNKIAKLERKYKNLKFSYTGPWPPYSFVNIKIKGG